MEQPGVPYELDPEAPDMLMNRYAARPRGFTLVELVVTMAVLALLAIVAAPSLGSWMANSRVRTAADYIQDGLRLAQTEAVKQNQEVAFVLSNVPANSATMPPPAAGATVSVSYWYAATVAWTQTAIAGYSSAQTLVAAGATSSDATQAIITGPPVICFSPYGRLTATITNTSGAGITTCGPGTSVTYVVQPNIASATAHPLNVQLSANGQVRMCDPAKSINVYPDGC